MTPTMIFDKPGKYNLTLIEHSTSAFIKLVKSFLTSHQLNYKEKKLNL